MITDLVKHTTDLLTDSGVVEMIRGLVNPKSNTRGCDAGGTLAPPVKKTQDVCPNLG